MSTFRYHALNAEGQPLTGEVQAESVQQALAELESRGLNVQSIGYATPAARTEAPAAAPKRAEAHDARRTQAMLRTHLARVLEDGRAIASALRAYAEEMPGGPRRRELLTLVRLLEHGDAAEAERTFAALPDYWIPLLSAAASSRDPGRVLHEFLQESQRTEELRRQWRLTFAYPLLIVVLALVVLIAISLLIVPAFREMFADFGLALPAFTQLVLTISWWLNRGWVWIAIALLLVAVAFWLYTSRLPLPIRGLLGGRFRLPSARATSVARFARFTADLLEAGLTIPDAVRIAAISTPRPRLQRAAAQLAADIEAGDVREAPSEARYLTSALNYALRTEMPAAARRRLLREISQAHAEKARRRVSWSRGLVEPPAIIAVGVVVGAVVIALFLPLVRLIDGLAM